MKKYFLFVLCGLFLFVVTGCGNANVVKCTGTMEESGQKISAEIVAEFDKDDKLVDATITEDVGSKETADQMCALYKAFMTEESGVSISCSGSKVTIKGYAKMAEDEDEDEKIIGMTKEEFKKYMSESSEGQVTCK